MNPKKLYRVPANYVKRHLVDAEVRPDASDIHELTSTFNALSENDEFFRDYTEESLHQLGLVPAGGIMGIMAASAPVAKIPSIEQIAQYHNKKVLWYPFLAARVAPIKRQGIFNDDYPLAICYHYNAGGNDPIGTMNSGRKNNYLFSACGRFGEFVQSNPFNEWGSHMGKSTITIKGKVRSGASAFLHGVEVNSAGSVDRKIVVIQGKKETRYAAYFHKREDQYFKESECQPAGPIPNQLRGSGNFHKFTDAQELAMERFALFMKVNNPRVFQIELCRGHDEAATPFGRKVDPGGCLSMPMKDWREKVQRQFDSMGLKKV